MKLSNRQLRGYRLDISMTSMIDVVFLLLIFFIVTTTFVRPEREVASAIKVNQKQAASDNVNLEPAIVDIIRQDDKALYRIGAVRTNDLQKVKDLLDGFENKSEGAFVRVAGDVNYGTAAKVIGACRASGFQSVSYIPLE